MQRAAGILLPIFSLPGPFASGVWGAEALDFAEKLSDTGFKYWQILPVNPPGAFFSPYSPLSNFAGNAAFLDPRSLADRGLVSKSEVETLKRPYKPRIDYPEFFRLQEKILHSAFSHLRAKDWEKLEEFQEEESYWLPDYASYMAIKDFYQKLPWWEWPDKALQQKEAGALASFLKDHEESYKYYCYQQYEFSLQYPAIKAEINRLGLSIIGDIPIYPAADSSDFWGKRELFETDESGRMRRVAGVPPDYFSTTGQLWGNPLYDWDYLKAEGYSYWLKRLAKCLEYCDVLRIDHFRGFSSYWAIPAGESTAVKGSWERGPAMHLFERIFAEFPQARIIAEDLGEISEDVVEFLRESALPGMKVLQFAFDPQDPFSLEKPHHYPRNSVAFTGTHDNDTLLGWARNQDDSVWQLFRTYLDLDEDARDVEGPESPLCRRAILTLLQSVADTVIFPAQDLLGQGSERRLNLPGTVGPENWTNRFSQDELASIDYPWLKNLLQACQR